MSCSWLKIHLPCLFWRLIMQRRDQTRPCVICFAEGKNTHYIYHLFLRAILMLEEIEVLRNRTLKLKYARFFWGGAGWCGFWSLCYWMQMGKECTQAIGFTQYLMMCWKKLDVYWIILCCFMLQTLLSCHWENVDYLEQSRVYVLEVWLI